MISTSAFDYINVMDKAADASFKRETLLTNNVANVDTPGYKRKDLDFQTVLDRELGRTKFGSLDQRIRRLNTDLSSLTVSPYTDAGNFSYRLDENNVDPDTEPVELASEQLRYELITQSIGEEFSRIQAAIK